MLRLSPRGAEVPHHRACRPEECVRKSGDKLLECEGFWARHGPDETLANGLHIATGEKTWMRHLSTGHESVRPAVLAVVMLLGLALVMCLVHIDCDEAGMDMVHGGCGVALVASFFTAAVVLASLNWWLLPGWAIPSYAVSLHLPDPPPKSPALL